MIWSVTCLQCLIAHCQYLLTGGRFLPFIRISMLRTPHATCIFMSHRISLVKPSPLQFRALHMRMRVRQTYLLLLHQYSLWCLVSLSIGVIECCFCCCRCIVGVYCSEPTLQCPGKAALESVAGEVDTHWCVPTGRPRLPATAAATAGWGKWSCCQHPMCRETVL